MVRHFLSQNDLSASEILALFARTEQLKANRNQPLLPGKSLVMFFEKTSTRTRLSFEIGMTQLGGHAVYVDRESSQLSRGESIEDTARVVSRYADLIMARVYAHATVAALARAASIPVINGLSDLEHPCQSLTDFFTVYEHLGRVEGVRVAYVGDARNNVTHSLMIAAAQLGAHLAIGSPPDLRPDPQVESMANVMATTSGGSITTTSNPTEAVAGADVVYTDVWVSMGKESDAGARRALLAPYQVNAALMDLARPEAVFMHCLPAHIGEEVTADVAYGPHSVIFDQAENRLHVQKALMVFLAGAASDGEVSP